MSKSPLNFLGGIAGISSGLGGNRNIAALAGIFGRKKGMKGRINKLENQMGVLMRDRNKNATSEMQDMGPGELTVGGEPVSADQPSSVNAMDLLTQNNPANLAMNLGRGQNMFGNSIPGSFDRDMGQDEQIY